MIKLEKIAVCSRSFSQNKKLREMILNEYNQVTFNETGKSLSGNELVEFLKGHDGAIIALEKLNHDIVKELNDLKVIGKYGVGLNNLDLQALEEKSIQIGWTGGVNKRSVSELVIGLMIDLLRNISLLNRNVRQQVWEQKSGFQLTGKKIGIVGFGHVGRDLAKLLSVFEVEVLVHDVLDINEECQKLGYEFFYRLEDLLAQADIVSLHVPYKQSTHNLISSNQLEKMKQGAYLINTSRGGIVNEISLYEALKLKKISGAAFDVLEVEPCSEHPLFELDNFIITSHIGGSSQEAILKMGEAAIKGLSVYRPAIDYKDFI